MSLSSMSQSSAGVTTEDAAAPPAPTCWTRSYNWGCIAGACVVQWLLWLLDKLKAGGKRVVHVFIPCMCISTSTDRMVVNRITNSGALAFEMKFVACLLFGASLAHLGFHTWAHLPALRQAGIMPEPPAYNSSGLSATSITYASTSNVSVATNATNGTQDASRVSLALAIGDSLLKWLNPRRIDIIQRCTYTCFFIAAGFAVWLCLGVSCAIRHKVDNRVLNVATLHDDVRWWWVPCHQAIVHMGFVAVFNLALYLIRAPFIKPWEGWDAALYVWQVWYVLLMLGFQWCALGGLKRHEPIRGRMMASPKHFFLEELLSAGGTAFAVLSMMAWLCIPFVAPMLNPDLAEKLPKLHTGCRLSWQSDAHSWYSCLSLANATTHRRIIESLLFIWLGALGSVTWAFVCYCTAIAGRQRQQQTWCEWARHVLSAVAKGVITLCQIALKVMTRQAGYLEEAQDPSQQAAGQKQLVLVLDAFTTTLDQFVQESEHRRISPMEVQAVLPVMQQHFNQLQQIALGQTPGAHHEPEANAAPQVAEGGGHIDIRGQALINNTAFAKHWWRHTAAAYLGVGFHGAYCMTIVLLQGQHINPYRLQHESTCVHGAAMALLLVRTYYGVMAWRTVAQVHDPHDD